MIQSAFSYLNQASTQLFQTNLTDSQKHQLIGQTLTIGGRQYAVRNLIAEGGYALVFTVQDAQSGEWYALKRQLAADRQSSDAIVKEIKFLKQLKNHPSIVNFSHAAQINTDAGRTRTYFSEFLILTELCSGGPLINLMQKRPLTVEQVLKIFHATSQAVKHMHDRNPPITHRDIKIENLLFDAKGYIKLCDFGSATIDIYRPDDEWNILMRSQLEEEMAKYTTPMYRAPEILDTYQNYPIGPAQDIWALGCVLFYLCYRVHPFEDSAKLRILNAKYTLPTESPYQVFHDLIRITLQPDPYSRPSIQDLCEQVEHVGMALDVDLYEPAVQLDQLDPLIADEGHSSQTTPSELSEATCSRNASQSVNVFASQLKNQGMSILKTLRSSAGQFKSQLTSQSSGQPSIPTESIDNEKRLPPRPPPPSIDTKAMDMNEHKKSSALNTNDFFNTLDWNSVSTQLQSEFSSNETEQLGEFVEKLNDTGEKKVCKQDNIEILNLLDDSNSTIDGQINSKSSLPHQPILSNLFKEEEYQQPAKNRIINDRTEPRCASSQSGKDLLNLLDAELSTSSITQMPRNASTPNISDKNGTNLKQKNNIVDEFLAMKLDDMTGGTQKKKDCSNYSRANFMDQPSTDVPKNPNYGNTFDDLLSSQGFISSKKQTNRTLADLSREREIKDMDPVSIKIIDWTRGKERNIRALLGSLSDVLWDEAKAAWKQPSVADLFEADNIKRHYRRACLVVHPDKQSNTVNELLAKAIFTELNDAWTEFQKNN